MPVVSSELNKTVLAPPAFDLPLVNPRKFAKNCLSNSVRAVPLHVFPSLHLITTATSVTRQLFTVPFTTNSSLVTEIFPILSCCTNPSPRVKEQLIVTSQAFTIPVVASGKVGETSRSEVPFRAEAPFSFASRPLKRHNIPLESFTTSCKQSPLSINALLFLSTMGETAAIASVSLSARHLAQVLAASKKDHLS